MVEIWKRDRKSFFPKECKSRKKITSALRSSLVLARLSCKASFPEQRPPAPCIELAVKCMNLSALQQHSSWE